MVEHQLSKLRTPVRVRYPAPFMIKPEKERGCHKKTRGETKEAEETARRIIFLVRFKKFSFHFTT